MAPERPFAGTSSTYWVKLTLCGSDPSIVREISVPKFATLFDLHNNIQSCFGWSDCHMHIYSCDGTEYGIPYDDYPDCEDETLTPLSRFESSVLDYNYDFGDDWHVAVEILGDAPNNKRWSTLLSWDCNGPPEDCGGIRGFYEKLEILSDPRSEDRDDIAEFMEGYEFDESDTIDGLYNIMPQGVRPADALIAPVVVPTLLMMPIFTVSSEPVALDVSTFIPYIIKNRPIRRSKRRGSMDTPPTIARKEVEAHPERYLVFSEDPAEIFMDVVAEFLEDNSVPVPDTGSDIDRFLERAMDAIERRDLDEEWSDFMLPAIYRRVYDWASENGIYFMSLEEAPLYPIESMMNEAHDAVGDGASLEEFLDALMKASRNL